MQEKNLYALFQKWLKEHKLVSAAYELKICKGSSLPFDAVKDHQIRALQIAKYGMLVHKISDFDMIGWKPFDIFALYNVEAYVVVVFYKPRKPIEFLLIDIGDFVQERDSSKRKSLTEKRAKEICT